MTLVDELFEGTLNALTLQPNSEATANNFGVRFVGGLVMLGKMMPPVTVTTPQWSMNNLLASLPSEDYQRVSADLTWRPLKVRQVLHKHGEPVSEVYFPGRSVCSITNVMEDGGVVEVATVGREGMVGIAAVFGAPVATGEAFVQIAAEPAAVMSIDAFRREMDRRGAFHDRVTRYSQAFVNMLMQSVACNGLHSAEERCCRWLLMTHDRIGQDEFPLDRKSTRLNSSH